MTRIANIGSGCAAALAAIAHLPHVKVLLESAQEADKEAVRSRILTSRGHGCVAGQQVQVGSEVYVIAGAPSRVEMDLERMVRASSQEPKRSAPAYGSDRPYLKKKKGRS
ncbi:hypothetical protein [Duganella callida]|uniref:Uncharacterized protein n=1 Tax=Duganella callida TaxID=2561932 RepID=A0A4Y9S414_9BURK|nr:hypothetical protein [Duganella callida]TFW15911.1 hypothetical protein E4L98_24750 [Duganella callida]